MMKRRSLLPPTSLNESLNTSLPVDDVDEDAERRGRVRIHRRHSIIQGRPGASVAANDPTGTPVQNTTSSSSGFSASQLADHYLNCMKLSAENKISVKNAFNLHMIDYMAEMVRKKAAGMDNFQAASCALDASAKIYGYRVDSLHSDTLKLAGGVGKTAEEAGVTYGAGGGDGNDDGADVGEGGPAAKKPRRRKNGGATIEKNLNNISLTKFDEEFEVDPLFKKISAQFDSGGGGGKFLCNLLTRDDSCQLLLNSDCIQFMPGERGCSTQEKINEHFVWPKSWPNKLEDSLIICPEFQTFRFLNWSLENDDDMESSFIASSQSTKPDAHPNVDGNEHVFDVNAPVDFDDDDAGFGADFVGADDGCNGDGEDGTEVYFDDKREEFRGGQMNQVKGVISDVENLKRHLSYIPSEYTYFDSGRFNQWAGPQHWKFSRPRFPTMSQLPGAPAKTKSAKPKEQGPHDFKTLYDNTFNEDNLTFDQIVKGMSVPKVPFKLQPKTMSTWTEDKLLLPGDLHFSGKEFAILYHSDFHITTKPLKQLSVDDSVTDYNFNNDNDVANFCPEVNHGAGGGYDDDDGGDMMDGDDDPFGQTAGGNLGDGETMVDPSGNGDAMNHSLVAAPNRVEKIAIGYAKQAKKMDMRRLKSIEWDLLTTSIAAAKENKENKDVNMKDEEEKVVKEEEETKPSDCTFAKLYQDLHESKKMPKQMAENLSVPLAFVALLHLCNENNLSLLSRPDLTDFTIICE